MADASIVIDTKLESTGAQEDITSFAEKAGQQMEKLADTTSKSLSSMADQSGQQVESAALWELIIVW